MNSARAEICSNLQNLTFCLKKLLWFPSTTVSIYKIDRGCICKSLQLLKNWESSKGSVDVADTGVVERNRNLVLLNRKEAYFQVLVHKDGQECFGVVRLMCCLFTGYLAVN